MLQKKELMIIRGLGLVCLVVLLGACQSAPKQPVQVAIDDAFTKFALTAIEYILTVSLVYFIFSSLYYFGSNKGSEWRFFSAGSTVATLLSIISTLGFRLYVENFNSYNKLYGSVGTLLVLMILIYVNCFVVLIGFELNRSIDKATGIGELEILKESDK